MYERALGLYEDLVAADPREAYRQDLANTLNNLGILDYENGRPKAALELHRRPPRSGSDWSPTSRAIPTTGASWPRATRPWRSSASTTAPCRRPWTSIAGLARSMRPSVVTIRTSGNMPIAGAWP